MWDFENDPDFQPELDWIESFVRDQVQPLDHLIANPLDLADPLRDRLIPPLQAEVKARGLWACHLGPELGGKGYGQVKLALMNEILGRSVCAPVVFGCQAPDTGNAEILAHFGTAEQKATYLEPLLDGRILSCFAMTEPQGGADPTEFVARAELDGDQWVINGEKWFASHARYAAFQLVMAVTDPDNPPHRRLSVFIVPTGTPGIGTIRNVAWGTEPDGDGDHAYLRYNNVAVPADHLLGNRGDGFVVAQVRLGGGRIHHAMRTVGKIQQALDMMCERALSRYTKGELLGKKQLVQSMIADSWIELEQFRLLVLRTAWKIDKYGDYQKVRRDIAAVKCAMPKVLHDVAARALHLHGALGVSTEMPLTQMVLESFALGIADGPTEVHKVTVARELLKDRRGTDELFPTTHLPAVRARSRQLYADVLAGMDS